jgi:hypothetical protein
MSERDKKFESRLTAALIRAAELDDMDTPSEAELERIIQPSARFQRQMRRLFKKPPYLRACRTAAAVFITLAVLLGSLMAVSSGVRAAMIDFVRSWFGDRSEYTVPFDNVRDSWRFGYIPEGFELAAAGDRDHVFREYRNGEGISIVITIGSGTNTIDNEHSHYYQTALNGHRTDIYESTAVHYPSVVLLYYESEQVMVTISADYDVNELLQIAENVSK